jgi:glycerol kinase
MLAARAVNMLPSEKLHSIMKIDKEFTPKITTTKRITYCNGWKAAVAKAREL